MRTNTCSATAAKVAYSFMSWLREPLIEVSLFILDDLIFCFKVVIDRAIFLASALKQTELKRDIAIADQRARKQIHITVKLKVVHFHSITFFATPKTEERC